MQTGNHAPFIVERGVVSNLFYDGLCMMVRKCDLHVPCIANPEPPLVKNLPTPLTCIQLTKP